MQYIPAIIPEAYQEWAKDVELKGSSTILFTMKGIMNATTNQNPDIHIDAKIDDGWMNYKKSSSPIKNINLVSTVDLQALDPDKMRVKVENLDFKLLDGTTKTNYSGGIQGGVSNGMDIYFKVAFKPVATLMQEQTTLNADGEMVEMHGKGRHDPCVVPRAVPIVESLAAMVLADMLLIQRTRNI